MTRAWPAENPRYVVCLGTQKAATSFLFSALEKSGQVCVPSIKEVHYWDMVYGVENRRWRRRSRAMVRERLVKNWKAALSGDTEAKNEIRDGFHILSLRYLAKAGRKKYKSFLLKSYRGESVVFEASPGYSVVDAETFGQMVAFAPDTRLLLIMRDPVERMWSAAKYIWRRKLTSGQVGEGDVIEFFLDRIRNPLSLGFRHSAYDKTFDAIARAGASSRFHVLFQETLSSKVEQQELTNCLGITVPIDFGMRINIHQEHFPLPEDARREAVVAFESVYDAVRKRYSDRVPDAWYG